MLNLEQIIGSCGPDLYTQPGDYLLKEELFCAQELLSENYLDPIHVGYGHLEPTSENKDWRFISG